MHVVELGIECVAFANTVSKQIESYQRENGVETTIGTGIGSRSLSYESEKKSPAPTSHSLALATQQGTTEKT